MDLNLLSLFVSVTEAASFSKTAEKLGVPRSSVSRGIAALERSLGVQLLSRSTRHVALTTAGTTLYAKVAPQLAALRSAMGSLPEREEQPSGTLRLTAPNDLGAIVLPAVFAAFALRYPAIDLDVRLTNRQVDLVGEGFDLALRVSGTRLSDSSLVARKLAAAPMQVFAAPAYLARAGTPRGVEEAANHAWVLFPAIGTPPPLLKPTVTPRVRGDDIRFVHEMIREGVGLGLLPAPIAREDLAAGRLVRVLPRVAITAGALYLVHPPSKHVPRKVTAFRDFLVDQLSRTSLFG